MNARFRFAAALGLAALVLIVLVGGFATPSITAQSQEVSTRDTLLEGRSQQIERMSASSRIELSFGANCGGPTLFTMARGSFRPGDVWHTIRWIKFPNGFVQESERTDMIEFGADNYFIKIITLWFVGTSQLDSMGAVQTYTLASGEVITRDDTVKCPQIAFEPAQVVVGKVVTLTAVQAGSASMEWWIAGGDIVTGNQVTYTPTTAGPLVVTVTSFAPIGPVSNTVTLNVTNTVPIANGGPDQNVIVSTTVTLDGSASTDPNGHMPLTYEWQQTGGVSVILSDATIGQPTFTAPSAPTVLTFTLTVTDSFGLASEPDTVVVAVAVPPVEYRLFFPLAMNSYDAVADCAEPCAYWLDESIEQNPYDNTNSYQIKFHAKGEDFEATARIFGGYMYEIHEITQGGGFGCGLGARCDMDSDYIRFTINEPGARIELYVDGQLVDTFYPPACLPDVDVYWDSDWSQNAEVALFWIKPVCGLASGQIHVSTAMVAGYARVENVTPPTYWNPDQEYGQHFGWFSRPTVASLAIRRLNPNFQIPITFSGDGFTHTTWDPFPPPQPH